MSGVDCLLWHVCVREEDGVMGHRATERCLECHRYSEHIVPTWCPGNLMGSVVARAGGPQLWRCAVETSHGRDRSITTWRGLFLPER